LQDKLAGLLAEAERMRAGSTMALPSHASKSNFQAAGAVPMLNFDAPIDLPGDVKIEVKEEL
jgi:transcription initiation factor TFIIB